MSKLYIFAIGGTGSRVLKAFTFLSGAGMKLANCSEIIPIVIDTDTSNGDLLKNIEVLRLYCSIRDNLKPSQNGFFNNHIQDINSLFKEALNEDQEIAKPSGSDFLFRINSVLNKQFKDFLGLNTVDNETKNLLQLLYTQKNFDDVLTKGFLGNPNVGSIVLNQLKENPSYKFFESTFQPEDRIFIISSIFGGTGAAGFPLLLKNFRSASSAGGAAIKNCKIGAVSVLPYFNLNDDDESSISSSSFISKTKASLNYYSKNLLNVNALYFVGDTPKASYNNKEGGKEQENKAHLVELVSALSIFHFMEQQDNSLSASTFEFSVNIDDKDCDINNFDELAPEVKGKLGKCLTKMFFLSKFNKYQLSGSLKFQWAKELHFSEQTEESSEFNALRRFLSNFENWIDQLRDNKRSFTPIINPGSKSDYSNILNTKPITTSLFNKGLNKDHFITELNKSSNKIKDFDTPFNDYLNLFWTASDNIIKNKIPHF